MCSIGNFLSEPGKCSPIATFRNRKKYSKESLHILTLRAGVVDQAQQSPITSVCESHHAKYMVNFSTRERRCMFADKHRGKRPHEIRPITYELFTRNAKYCHNTPALVPGRHLCQSCRLGIQKRINDKIAARKLAREKAAKEGVPVNLSFSSNSAVSSSQQSTGAGNQVMFGNSITFKMA